MRKHWNDHISVPLAVRLPPAVVSVGPVGFGHLVQLKLLLDNVALLGRRCQQLLREFLVHVCPSVSVLPALCDHPFHGEEATSVLRKRDGHLSGTVKDQMFRFMLRWNRISNRWWVIPPLFPPGRTFLLSVCWPDQRWVYSSPNPGERSHKGCTRWFPFPPVELCGIFPPASSWCSPGSGRRVRLVILLTQNQQQIFYFTKAVSLLPVSRSLWPKPYFRVSSSCWQIYWKIK